MAWTQIREEGLSLTHVQETEGLKERVSVAWTQIREEGNTCSGKGGNESNTHSGEGETGLNTCSGEGE